MATAVGVLSTAAAIVGIGAWYGCSIYDSSLLLPGPDEGGAETGPGTDGGPDAAPEVSVSCPETFPPKAPSADDPSDAGSQTSVTALHTLDLGIVTDGGTPPLFGYDLDDVYTCCDGGPSSCTPPIAGAHCDENGGRDNSGGQLISNLAILDPTGFNATTISQRLQQGVYSIIVQLADYNGQPNDTQVVAGLYASDGLDPGPDGGVPVAKWDGSDVWSIDSAFVLSGGDSGPIVPSHYDAHAYVANGTLVMQVNFPLSLGTGNTGNITIFAHGRRHHRRDGDPGAERDLLSRNGVQVAGRWTWRAACSRRCKGSTSAAPPSAPARRPTRASSSRSAPRPTS